MRESRLGQILGGLLPRGIREDAYEPARRDLELMRLEAGAEADDARRWPGMHALRLFLLFIDCWRLALLHPASAWRSAPSHAPPAPRRNPMILPSLWQALVRLRREPAFTVAAVLTLALGVGANVAVFAVIEAVLLRPLPYAEADRLVILEHRDVRTGITKEFIAIGDFVDIDDRQTSFERVASYGSFQTTILEGGEPLAVGGLSAGPEIFAMLGVRPALGRALEPDDAREGAAPVVMLGYALWRDRFASDPGVIGRGLRVGRVTRTIVGVAPEGFRFPPGAESELILPQGRPLEAPAERKSGWVFAVAKLRPGQTAETATSELGAISKEMETNHPASNQGSTYFAVSLRDSLVGNTKQALVLLLAAVGFVLLIACANVANLQLARSLARRREIAVRLALGAGRARLVGMFIAESLVLATLAGVAGIAIAHWGVRGLVALIPASVDVPGLQDVHLNVVVLAFALAIALASALAFGFLAASTVNIERAGDVLVTAGRASTSRSVRRTTAGLVIVEVALAVVLLIGAGLVLRSFTGLLGVDPGFAYDDVLTMEIQLPSERYAEPAAREAFYARAFDAVRAIPGVVDAGAAAVVPLTGNNWTVPFERPEARVPAGERPPDVGWQAASGGFFRALRIPLVGGRYFDERDGPGSATVVIVSEAIQREYFGGESAVGRRVQLGDGTAEIVGVVGDIRRAALSDAPRADMYFPFESSPGQRITLFIHTSIDAARAAPPVRSVLREIEPATAILTVRTLDDVAGESLRVTELVLWLLGVFAGCAIVLAAIGIYGVMSYAVRQRTREIGTRMAMGATRADIVRLVLRQGALIAVIGIGAGLLIGAVATRSLKSVLFGVSASDPVTIAAATLILAATILLACVIPARRASAVDPARTLAQN